MRSLQSFLVLGLLIGSGLWGFSSPDFDSLPSVRWEFQTGAAIYASPAADEHTVYIGSLNGNLYAIDLLSGKEKWSFHSGGEIRSAVCLSDEFVYLNGGNGNLYCLDINSGKLVWQFETGGEVKYDFADYFHSSPVLHEGVLYFGSGDSCLYAVNAQTGKKSWSFRSEGIIHSTPAISNNKLFFGSFDGYVYALNLADGKLLWKFKTVGHRYFPKGEVQGSPAVHDNLVFIGARDYNVYALDQDQGYCHWNKAFTNGWGLNCTLNNSRLYIGSADERRLICADPTTGWEYWNVPMEFLVFGNDAFSDSLLYVGTTIGKMHGVSLKTGKKIWSFETNSYLSSRSKYFKEDDSYRDDIYSIILSNEQFLEVECELGGIFSAPVIISNFLVFSSTNGKVYALQR